MNQNEQSSLNDVEISCDSLSEFLRVTYPDRVPYAGNNRKTLEALFSKLIVRGYNKIGDVLKAIDRTKEAIEMFERDNPPHIGPKDDRYTAASIVNFSILILDDDFFASKGFLDAELRKKLKPYRKYIVPD